MQGSTLDSKDGFDFLYGDWSERTEPRGTWCHWHGYYDCPECDGSEVTAVVVPVVSAPAAGWEIEIAPVLPPRAFVLPPAELEPAPFVSTADAPISSDPSLLDRVRELFTPGWKDEREAAARRGRLVHERAVELVEETGCSYDEGIAEALRQG